MTVNTNSSPDTTKGFPTLSPIRQKTLPDIQQFIYDRGIRSPYAVQNKTDARGYNPANKFHEPVVLGYHDDYQVLFGLENFRATYAAGSRNVEDYVILKFDAPAPALKAIALAHEYRNNRKFPFGELVKVVAEEGLEWAETYGSFVQASKADINVLRVAYAHGLAPYIKDYPVAVIKGVVKDKIPYILTGRINAKEAMELEALQTKEKQHDGYVKDTELTAALNRAIRAERKADAMDRAMREFFSGVEQSAIPTRYRNKLVEILKAAVDNNPVG